MKVQVEDLVTQVKVNMEEVTDSQVSIAELTVGVDVESYIRAKLPEAVLSVWTKMPLSILPRIDCASSLAPVPREDGSGMVILPEEVWKVVEFRMKGWKRSVTKFLERDSPECELQNNPHTRGNSTTPVCVLYTLEDRKCIEYYSLPKGSTDVSVESALYIPYPESEYNSYNNMPAEMVPIVCYTCAAMVYEILGQPDLAAAMLRGIVQ